MENATVALDGTNSSVVGVSGTSVDAVTLTLVGADGFICLFGLFGNVLIIYVIRSRWSSSKSKAVTTNTFILNLSINVSSSVILVLEVLVLVLVPMDPVLVNITGLQVFEFYDTTDICAIFTVLRDFGLYGYR